MNTYIPELLLDGPSAAATTVVLAHGAGAPMDSDFMAVIARGLAASGLRVARFEFPYMAERRATGKKRPPNPMPVLLETWRAVVMALGGPEGLVIGGKSLGGRVASLLAAEYAAAGTSVRGLVCLGYPFHAPGRPPGDRYAHLGTLVTPTLIVQGERDPFGHREEVAGYALSPAVTVHWLADGEHSFKPRKASGHTEAGNLAAAVQAVAGFVVGLPVDAVG